VPLARALPVGALFGNVQPGDVLTDWCIQSWMVTDKPSFGGVRSNGVAQLIAIAPKWSSIGGYTAPISAHGHEQEFTMNRGTGFLVHKAVKHIDSRGQLDIKVYGEVLS
jgi:hypothetical protein